MTLLAGVAASLFWLLCAFSGGRRVTGLVGLLVTVGDKAEMEVEGVRGRAIVSPSHFRDSIRTPLMMQMVLDSYKRVFPFMCADGLCVPLCVCACLCMPVCMCACMCVRVFRQQSVP